MASEHPVDAAGRALPSCDWPAERAAPGGLEKIRRLCNTANLESGADRLSTAAGLDEWLTGQGDTPMDAGRRTLARVVAVRELLRAQAIAHRAHPAGDHAAGLRELATAVRGVRLRITEGDGTLRIEPDTSDPLDRFLAGLILGVVEAERAGTWPRLKACRNCSWVFYDGSKNRSGRWCSMSACGGRAKVRAYRQRARTPDTT